MIISSFTFFVNARSNEDAALSFGDLVMVLGPNFPDFLWIINSVKIKEYQDGIKQVTFDFALRDTPLQEVLDFLSSGKWFQIQKRMDFIWDKDRSKIDDVENVFIVPEIIWANVQETENYGE